MKLLVVYALKHVYLAGRSFSGCSFVRRSEQANHDRWSHHEHLMMPSGVYGWLGLLRVLTDFARDHLLGTRHARADAEA